MPASAQNTIIFVSSATASSTGSSANVGYVTGFSGPDGQAAEIDITSFQSLGKEYLIGLHDEGNISVDFLAEASHVSHKNLIEAKQAGTLRCCKIRLADAATSQLDFFGYVKNFSIAGAVDDKYTGNCVIRISGSVTWTTA